jgi:hypothetical protein
MSADCTLAEGFRFYSSDSTLNDPFYSVRNAPYAECMMEKLHH